jgi:hypothetical protein
MDGSRSEASTQSKDPYKPHSFAAISERTRNPSSTGSMQCAGALRLHALRMTRESDHFLPATAAIPFPYSSSWWVGELRSNQVILLIVSEVDVRVAKHPSSRRTLLHRGRFEHHKKSSTTGRMQSVRVWIISCPQPRLRIFHIAEANAWHIPQASTQRPCPENRRPMT